jgi:hypothetical protein
MKNGNRLATTAAASGFELLLPAKTANYHDRSGQQRKGACTGRRIDFGYSSVNCGYPRHHSQYNQRYYSIHVIPPRF